MVVHDRNRTANSNNNNNNIDNSNTNNNLETRGDKLQDHPAHFLPKDILKKIIDTYDETFSSNRKHFFTLRSVSKQSRLIVDDKFTRFENAILIIHEIKNEPQNLARFLNYYRSTAKFAELEAHVIAKSPLDAKDMLFYALATNDITKIPAEDLLKAIAELKEKKLMPKPKLVAGGDENDLLEGLEVTALASQYNAAKDPQERKKLAGLLKEKVRHGYKYVNLAGATFAGIDLNDCYCGSINFTNANLSGAQLNKVNFFGAILIKTILTNASLIEADFRFANLTGSQLKDANLDGANMDRAFCPNIITMNAKLSNAKNINQISLFPRNALQGVALENIPQALIKFLDATLKQIPSANKFSLYRALERNVIDLICYACPGLIFIHLDKNYLLRGKTDVTLEELNQALTLINFAINYFTNLYKQTGPKWQLSKPSPFLIAGLRDKVDVEIKFRSEQDKKNPPSQSLRKT